MSIQAITFDVGGTLIRPWPSVVSPFGRPPVVRITLRLPRGSSRVMQRVDADISVTYIDPSGRHTGPSGAPIPVAKCLGAIFLPLFPRYWLIVTR